MFGDCAALGGSMAPGPPSASVGSRLRLLELLLGPLLVLLVCGVEPARGQNIFTNTWAVHIPGGKEEAHRIASKHGFINHGHVFGDFYHFRHRAVVKRALSDHRGTRVRLLRDPKVRSSWCRGCNHEDSLVFRFILLLQSVGVEKCCV